MSKQCLITRTIEIDAAHRVPDHRSKCFNMHGHRYVVDATLQGPVIQEGEQTGMVMDFGFLKECMMVVIHNNCDHAAILSAHDPLVYSILGPLARDIQLYESSTWEGIPGWKLFIIPEVPTAENLAMVWHGMLETQIERYFRSNYPDKDVPELVRVCVWETPNCMAEYPVF